MTTTDLNTQGAILSKLTAESLIDLGYLGVNANAADDFNIANLNVTNAPTNPGITDRPTKSPTVRRTRAPTNPKLDDNKFTVRIVPASLHVML